MRKHQVGDICVTVNTKHPAINDGVLVVIVWIDSSLMEFKDEKTPYLIRRVDGQVMGSTVDCHPKLTPFFHRKLTPPIAV